MNMAIARVRKMDILERFASAAILLSADETIGLLESDFGGAVRSRLLKHRRIGKPRGAIRIALEASQSVT